MSTVHFNASHAPPTHPLTGISILHPLQIHPLWVRVLDNADQKFAMDSYWDDVPEEQRVFGFRVLSKLLGGKYPVMTAEHYCNREAYRIRIIPELHVHTLFGVPQRVNAAHIPIDYVEIIEPLRFMEAS